MARAGRPYVEPLEGDGSTAIADEPAEAAWSPGSDMVVYATTFGKGNGAIQNRIRSTENAGTPSSRSHTS